MKKVDLGQTAQILANLGVIAGLVFLGFEIRTNTETNRILIFQGSSSNWMEINAQRATDRDLAEVLEVAFLGGEMDRASQWQFEGWVRQYLTHAAFMRRLNEAGLLSGEELDAELRDIRMYASNDRFREVLERLLIADEPFRRLILEY